MAVIRKRVYARVGLIGNPSDGFYGKTISLSISNFYAEVSIEKSENIELIANSKFDRNSFSNFDDLNQDCINQGFIPYSGGISLLKATCKSFYVYCNNKNITLGDDKFRLSYDTTIPRQVGLAGSSAIILATLKCLLCFYDIEHIIEKIDLPQFVLHIEMVELNITAGLQDRVIQVYEGMVYMDFDREMSIKNGHGQYDYLPTKDLPPLWLAYRNIASESGKIHNNVRKRFDEGDPVIIAAMVKFGRITDNAKKAILEKDWVSFSNLMDENFNLRREIYTEKNLDKINLKMISIARKYDSSAKFPGSGGAVIGCCLDKDKLKELKKEMKNEGFSICDISINETKK